MFMPTDISAMTFMKKFLCFLICENLRNLRIIVFVFIL
jgi:hypothetical protein